MKKLTTYKIKGRYGIDDLKGLFAYRGNSQGDNSGSNELGMDKKMGGWMSFVFDCEETQEAIDAEVKRRAKWNEDYIIELQKNGKYGTEYENSISFQHHPMFDEPKSETPLMSSSFFIMDVSEESQHNTIKRSDGTNTLNILKSAEEINLNKPEDEK